MSNDVKLQVLRIILLMDPFVVDVWRKVPPCLQKKTFPRIHASLQYIFHNALSVLPSIPPHPPPSAGRSFRVYLGSNGWNYWIHHEFHFARVTLPGGDERGGVCFPGIRTGVVSIHVLPSGVSSACVLRCFRDDYGASWCGAGHSGVIKKYIQ